MTTPSSPPASPLSPAGVALRLAAMALAGWMAWSVAGDFLFAPGRRDPRGIVFLYLPLAAIVYLTLSLALHVFVPRPRKLAVRILLAIFALPAGMVLSFKVEDVARARELLAVQQATRPLLDAVAAEQRRAGQPPADLQALLQQHLPSVPAGYYRLRTFLTYIRGPQSFAFAFGLVPADRDNYAYALYSSADGRWHRRELRSRATMGGLREGFADLVPALKDGVECSCRKQETGPWECEPSCGGPAPEPLAAAPAPQGAASPGSGRSAPASPPAPR